jgi:carboxypeptidase family protein
LNDARIVSWLALRIAAIHLSLEDIMRRMLCLAGAMLAFAAGTGTMAADQGRTSGPPIGGAHKGVIAGRVTDTSGQPVSGVLVTLMQSRTSRGVTRLHPVSVQFGSTTNTNGEFRLERLASGPYYVVALPRGVPRNVRIATDSQDYRFGYAITSFISVRASGRRRLTSSPGCLEPR